MNDNKVRAFCDTETTGLDYINDRLVEIGIIVCKGDKIIDKYEVIINPEMKIPYESSVIHNIYDKDVINAPLFKDIYKNIVDIFIKNNVESCIFHNADFDVTMISQEFSRLSKTNNVTDYIKSQYPDFIAERDRKYIIDEINKNKYTYSGEKISNSDRHDYGLVDLLPIEDTLRIAFNFHDLKSNTLNGLAAKLDVDSSARSKFHGALVDSELLMNCYFKLKNEVLKDYDFSDMSRNLNGNNFKKSELNDEDLIDNVVSSKLIKFSASNSGNDINNTQNQFKPKMF